MNDSKAHRPAELAASYALGVLDAEELRDFEAHLRGCNECRREVEEYRAVTGLLGYGVPARQPPAELRERILAAARASPQRETEPRERQREAERRERQGEAGRRERQGEAGRRERHRETRPRVRPPRPASRGWRPAAVLLAAASVLLAAVAVIGFARERQVRQQVEAELAQALDDLARTTDDLAQRELLVETFLGDSVSAARLVAAETDPSIRLFWNRERNSLLIAAYGLGPAGAGRTYQLWGIPDGQAPVSLGTFDTDAAGGATVVLPVPAGVDVADSAVSAVTDEPAGGSPQPTTTPFLVGPWEHAR